MQKTIKILAIDKEEIILKSIRKALKGNADTDYFVTTCTTALEGLKLIRSNTYDIVFIDLVLPGDHAQYIPLFKGEGIFRCGSFRAGVLWISLHLAGLDAEV